MKGPYELGTIAGQTSPTLESWEVRHALIRGRRYRVVKSFIDLDGDIHPLGEEWLFIAGLFSKFDDEVTMCIRRNENQDWKISLDWNIPSQADVIENVVAYLKAV